MGDHLFLDNFIFIRKYRNRFHVWFEQQEQDWITFFKAAYNGRSSTVNPPPKKLIIWEE